MRTIFKYKVPCQDNFSLEVPKNAILRHVGTQEREYPNICFWMEIDIDEESKENWNLVIFGTGHTIDDRFSGERVFLGTVTAIDGLVWHVFRDKK